MNRPALAHGSPLHSTAAAPVGPRRIRLAWLDLFRGAAVLVMIETHVVNTFLAASLRQTAWFPLLNYLNGLVAPSFLFIAGFMVGLERRTAVPGRPVHYRRRARRLLGIAALSQALHFPWPEILQQRWADVWRVGTQMNVLPCLAAALGLLLALGWIAEKLGDSGERLWWGGAVALAAIAVLGAPLAAGWVEAPLLPRALLNQSTGSLFPLFPWAGFVFFGALAGAWPERPLSERTATMIGLAVLAWACRGPIFSALSPAFFLERAAWVLALAACCEWTARRPVPAVFLFAGKNALKLYVAHLAAITLFLLAGLAPVSVAWGKTLGLLGIIGGMSLTAAYAVSRWTFSPSAPRPNRPLLDPLPPLGSRQTAPGS